MTEYEKIAARAPSTDFLQSYASTTPAYLLSNGKLANGWYVGHSNHERVIHYKDGRWHKEDGPAVFYSDGKTEYWIHDRNIETEEMALIILKHRLKIWAEALKE